MTLRLDASVYVEHYPSRELDIVFRVDSDTEIPLFRFELLLSRPGVRLENLKVVDTNGENVKHYPHDGKIEFEAMQFEISYCVVVDHSDCVGVDRETEFIFPFINENEVFFGTGLFPFPVNLHEPDADIELSFNVDGVSADWQMFSSLDVGRLAAAKLDNFFWYANADRALQQIFLDGGQGPIRFQLLVQREKTIPISSGEFNEFLSRFISWVESNIAPYRQLADINCLILQAPPDYLNMTESTSFATGENVINGIAAYGPDDPDNYQKLGCETYRDYLLEGIAHEFMHCFTTTAIQGKYKSILYPSPGCPPAHARFIGESMNLYCIYQFIGEYMGDPFRLQDHLKFHLGWVKNSKRRSGLLDAYLFDQFLVENGSSLLSLFSAMVKRKQEEPGPYTSGEFILETLREKMNIEDLSDVAELILGVATPDYNSIIRF